MTRLADGEVACFWIDRDRDRDWLIEHTQAMGLSSSPGSSQTDRARLAEHALRLVLYHRVGDRAAAATIATAPGGRPYLAGCAVEFSLTHSGFVSIVAVGSVDRLGVDLEVERRPLTIPPARRRRCLEAVAACPAVVQDLDLEVDFVVTGERATDDQDGPFLAAWTQLEAIAKADGRGVFALMADLGLRGRPHPGAIPPEIWSDWADGLALSTARLAPRTHVAIAHDAAARAAPLMPIRDVVQRVS